MRQYDGVIAPTFYVFVVSIPTLIFPYLGEGYKRVQIISELFCKAKAFSIFVVSIPTLIFPYLMERSTMEIWNFGLNMVFWGNVNILVD